MKMRLCPLFLAAVTVAPTWAADTVEFKDQTQKYVYSVGLSVGDTLRRRLVEPDVETLLRGLKEGLANKGTLSPSDARQFVNSYNEENRLKVAEKNRKEGQTFLEENKKKEGVVALPSGLQYKVLAEGKGTSPKASDTVTVNYRGTLVDGTEFDSSYKRNQPYTTALRGVVAGWTEALQLMKPGAKWQLFVPPDLAYRDNFAGDHINPGSTLVFEVELLSVKTATPPQPGATEGVTSDIIRVPSAEEMKKGAKVEVIKPEDLEKYKAAEKERLEKEKKEKEKSPPEKK